MLTLANDKVVVAKIVYYEELANGQIHIGSKGYDQDWNKILSALGYNRNEYTYMTEYVSEDEPFVSTNILTILEK